MILPSSRRSIFLPGIVLCCGVSLVCTSAVAQPPERSITVAAYVPEVEAAWKALREEVGTQEFTDTPAAISRYQQFYEQRGVRSARTAVEISSTIAQLYWQVLHNQQKALEIYDWALKTYDYLPQSRRLKAERDLVAEKGEFTNAVDAEPVMITPKAPSGTAPSGIAPVIIGAAPVVEGTPTPAKVLLGRDSAASPDAVHLASPTTNTPDAAAQALPGTVLIAPLSTSAQQPSSMSPINIHAVALTGFVTQWREGKATMEELFKNNPLTPQDALLMLSSPGILTSWKLDMPLRQKLMEWLQQNAPDLLKTPASLPMPTQLALAEYYTNHRDARAEKIYHDLLQQQFPSGVWWHKILVMNCLAEHYGVMGEYLKAAETKLQIGQLTHDEIWLGNIKVEAARFYTQAGEMEKAQALYKQAEKSTYGWAAGVAMYDQGRELISEEKYDEAIKVLSAPVKGMYADQVKIGLITLQGYAYYRQGKFNLAKQYCQQALDQYNALQNPLKNEGTEGSLAIDYKIIEWIPKWLKSPIICGPDHLDVVIDHEDKLAGTISRQMEVRTNQPASFVVTSDNPLITAHVDGLQNMSSNDWLATPLSYYFHSKLIVEISSEAVTEGLDASLVVQSKNFPDFEVNIPIHVEQEVAQTNIN